MDSRFFGGCTVGCLLKRSQCIQDKYSGTSTCEVLQYSNFTPDNCSEIQYNTSNDAVRCLLVTDQFSERYCRTSACSTSQ